MATRNLLLTDIDHIIDCMYSEREESPAYGDVVADEDYVRCNLIEMIKSTQFIGVIDDRTGGYMIGWATFLWYAPVLNAYEMNLYIPKEARGGIAAARIIRAFENKARAMGCQKLYTGASTGISDARVAALYTVLGYETPSDEGNTRYKEL